MLWWRVYIEVVLRNGGVTLRFTVPESVLRLPYFTVLEEFYARFNKSLTLQNFYSSTTIYIALEGHRLPNSELLLMFSGAMDRSVFLNPFAAQ